MALSYDDAFLYLAFDRERLRPGGTLWLVSSGQELELLPDHAIALKTDCFESLKECTGFFKQFSCLFLAIPDDETRQIVGDAIADYLPFLRIYEPADGAFRGRSSLAEIIDTGGEAALERLALGAHERPVYGLVNIADIRKPPDKNGVLSGIKELDRAIGGFGAGELSVWTGKRGSGKSTLLSQICLEAVEQGHHVCAYSGELSAWNFKKWALLQAAGPEYLVEAVSDYSEQTFYRVPAAISTTIDEWWDGKLFLYDNGIAGASETESILDVFRVAVLRYGCDTFLVDNLMSANLAGGNDRDFYRTQSSFVGRLVEFAKQQNVHIHLAAHPRKTEAGRNLSADDVGGSGDITNRADNCFALTRYSPDDALKQGHDAKLQVLKNRAFGMDGYVCLDFEPHSRRFYSSECGNPEKRFSWGSREAL